MASEVVRGKTPKTFQNLSFPFIASQIGEKGVRGDPNKSAHPVVNADFGPYIHAAYRTRAPPEQASGKPSDARSDIFSFGAVLYEMLAGRRAFHAETQVTTMAAVLNKEPEPLEAPEELLRIVMRCLRKSPADRFQNAAELRAALAGVKIGEEAEPPSIAVLPFANLSSDKDNEYFSDGLAEEILNGLTPLPGLRVIARASAFAFRGRENAIAEIGEKLKVGSVLHGSVRRSGNRIRVNVQLINVSDESQLWSERYDRELRDVFDIQDEIAQAIVAQLKVKLGLSRRSLLCCAVPMLSISLAASAEEYRFSGPYTHDNLSIFLIHGAQRQRTHTFLTLQEALDQKKVVVYETGNVNQLAIENFSGEDVYIQSGDIVKGGQQDRVFPDDFVLPKTSGRVPISSFCVEQGRWTRRGTERADRFSASADTLPTKSLKLAARKSENQQQVWEQVATARIEITESAGSYDRMDGTNLGAGVGGGAGGGVRAFSVPLARASHPRACSLLWRTRK